MKLLILEKINFDLVVNASDSAFNIMYVDKIATQNRNNKNKSCLK